MTRESKLTNKSLSRVDQFLWCTMNQVILASPQAAWVYDPCIYIIVLSFTTWQVPILSIHLQKSFRGYLESSNILFFYDGATGWKMTTLIKNNFFKKKHNSILSLWALTKSISLWHNFESWHANGRWLDILTYYGYFFEFLHSLATMEVLSMAFKLPNLHGLLETLQQ